MRCRAAPPRLAVRCRAAPLRDALSPSSTPPCAAAPLRPALQLRRASPPRPVQSARHAWPCPDAPPSSATTQPAATSPAMRASRPLLAIRTLQQGGSASPGMRASRVSRVPLLRIAARLAPRPAPPLRPAAIRRLPRASTSTSLPCLRPPTWPFWANQTPCSASGSVCVK